MKEPINYLMKALDMFLEDNGIQRGEIFTLYDWRKKERYGTACVSELGMISFNGEEWRNDRISELLSGKYIVLDENGRPKRIRGFELIEGKGGRLPERATEHSAGYDFFAIEDVKILPKNIRVVWTGVKAYMPPNEVLKIYNRSSNALKKGIMLSNGVGVVDADYYNNPDNEGDIGFSFYNFTNEIVTIKKGDKLGQGIFEKYYVADNDIHGGARMGGYGSTGK